MKNSDAKIAKKRLLDKGAEAEALVAQNMIEETDEKVVEASSTIEDVKEHAIDIKAGMARGEEVDAKIDEAKKEIIESREKLPEVLKAEVTNLKDLPAPVVNTEKVEFPESVKSFSVFKFINKIAEKILQVKIVQGKDEYVRVRFTDKKGNEVDSMPVQVSLAGASGPSKVGIKNASDTQINPMTEETGLAIKESVDNVKITADNINLNADQIDLSTDGVEGLLTDVKTRQTDGSQIVQSKKSDTQYTKVRKYVALSTTNETTLWDPGADKKFVVTDIHVSAGSAGTLTLRENTAGATVMIWDFIAKGGVTSNLQTPIQGTTNGHKLTGQASATTMYVCLTGYEV